MKRLLLLAFLAVSTTAFAQWSGATINVTNQIKLRGQVVTNFQTDTFLVSQNKLPTSKAVYDFVVGRTSVVSGGNTINPTLNFLPKKGNGLTLVDSKIMDNGNNVGINTAYPAWTLDVAGMTNTLGFRMKESENAGDVLTSDGSGQGHWMPPPASITSSGTLNYLPKFSPNSTALANSKIFDDGMKIGIGTATPLSKIHLKDTSILIDADTVKFKIATGYNSSNIGGMAINIYPPNNALNFGVLINYADYLSNDVDNYDVSGGSIFGISQKFTTGAYTSLIVERKNLNIFPDTIKIHANTTGGYGGWYGYGTSLVMKIYQYPNKKFLFNAYLKDLYLNTITPISKTDTTFYTYKMDANPLSRGDRFQIIHTSESLDYPKIMMRPELKSTAFSEVLIVDGNEVRKVKYCEKMSTVQKLALTGGDLFEGKEVYDLDLHKKSYYDGTVWVNY